MPPLFKKIISYIVLVSFLTVILFSFSVMMHGPNESVSNDCPFSAMGVSLCPQDAVAVVFHHISAYNSLFTVPVSFGVVALILSLLLAVCTVLILSLRPPPFALPVVIASFSDSPSVTSYDRKITHWLSLFENSPSQR